LVAAALACVLALLANSNRAMAQTASSLALRTLVVYNANNPDSVSVANYYVVKRNIPLQNLCAITPPATDVLTWSQYVSSVKVPVQACLNTLGPARILYIVFTYQTPYDVMGSTSPLVYALDQYVADIWDQYSTQDFFPYPYLTQLQPYYADSQSQGNVYQPFQSFSGWRNTIAAKLIYSVWRLDAPSAALAMGLVDKAIAAEKSGLSGQACLDRQYGDISQIDDSDYGEGDWDLHQAATFSGLAGFQFIEDSNPQEFGTPPAPNCPGAALYSGWYSYNHYNDAFTWDTGAIGFHLDSASAANPRGGANWSANAIIKGITVTTGAVNEPELQGLVRPGGTFRDLFQGANVGDAFLRNTRWLKWMILYLGDPLYRPFAKGLQNFNPPPAQASLGFKPRYFQNGETSTGTVTLAQAAPPGGTVVSLSSNWGALVQVPASVTVPQGQRSAMFTATSTASPLVTQDSPVVITAANVGQNTVTVWPLLGADVVEPTYVIGGAQSTGTVALNEPAPPGGATVSLSSDNYAQVPSTVTVPQGSLVANFPINTSFVSSQHDSSVKAALNGATVSTDLLLEPALIRMDLSSQSGPGGAPANAIPVLGAPAPPSGWMVNLHSANPQVASLPGSVKVPGGSSSTTVPITTTPQCSNVPVTLSALSGVSVVTATYTVTPPPPSGLDFPNQVQGGMNVNATVYLTYPACSAGLPVALSSSNPQVASVPSSVIVPGGQTQAMFVITTYPVNQQTQVTITATSDNMSVQRVLTVTP
jgi:uncharacterized protein (TIGR03790 family)